MVIFFFPLSFASCFLPIVISFFNWQVYHFCDFVLFRTVCPGSFLGKTHLAFALTVPQEEYALQLQGFEDRRSGSKAPVDG